MLKKRYNWDKQQIIRIQFKRLELQEKLKKTININMYTDPLIRLSLFKRYYKKTNWRFFFKTHQKLYCLLTLNNKIPQKKLIYSRFSLNKQFHKLLLSGFWH